MEREFYISDRSIRKYQGTALTVGLIGVSGVVGVRALLLGERFAIFDLFSALLSLGILGGITLVVVLAIPSQVRRAVLKVSSDVFVIGAGGPGRETKIAEITRVVVWTGEDNNVTRLQVADGRRTITIHSFEDMDQVRDLLFASLSSSCEIVTRRRGSSLLKTVLLWVLGCITFYVLVALAYQVLSEDRILIGLCLLIVAHCGNTIIQWRKRDILGSGGLIMNFMALGLYLALAAIVWMYYT